MELNEAAAKNHLRQQFRKQREERYVSHDFVHLIDLSKIADASVIASYYSYGVEPDTFLLNQKLINLGKTLLLPRINGDYLDWVQWDGNPLHVIHKGKFQEPVGDAFTDLDLIDVVLVPALAIDSKGNRLGQGGGYYDRALPLLRAWKHGVVFEYEKSSENLPHEPWDIPMDSW